MNLSKYLVVLGVVIINKVFSRRSKWAVCPIFISIILLPRFSYAGSSEILNLQSYERYGVVRYFQSEIIYSNFDGILNRIHVKAGQRVAIGDSLVTATPIHPGSKSVTMKNSLENAVISRIDKLEGKKVDSFEEILVVADDSQYIIVVNITPKSLKNIEGSGEPMVTFNPRTENSFERKGSIYAVHEPPQGTYGLSKVEVLVDCKDVLCAEKIYSGDFAKIKFENKIQ